MIGLTLAFLAGVLAAPNQPICRSIEQNANFDDLSSAIVPALSGVPAGYKGLYFQGFNYGADVDTGATPGIITHSPPNAAGLGVNTETQQGTIMITTNYPKTNTTSFSLGSFYYGCVTALQNGLADPPQSCIVNIAGYRGNDNQVSAAQQVCAQQFQYNPSTTLGAQEQAFTGAISCVDVQFVIITFSPQGGMAATSPTLGLVLDDIRFSSKNC